MPMLRAMRRRFEALLADPGNDAVLVHERADRARFARRDAAEAVVAVADTHRSAHGPAEAGVRGLGRRRRRDGGAFERPAFPTMRPKSMRSRGFMHLVRYREARDALMATPPSLPEDFSPDVAAARAPSSRARSRRPTLARSAGGRRACSRPMRFRSVPALLARDADEAAAVAAPLLAGHDRGGSRLCRRTSSTSRTSAACGSISPRGRGARRRSPRSSRARGRRCPTPASQGVTIHPMILRPKARELIAGIADDPTFGPVIVFGRGGTAVEVIDDKALALPPLDLKLAHELIARTRVSRILKAYRDVPAADKIAVALVLVKLAQLAADFPQMRELDINPLLADESGVIAVDVRIAVAPVEAAAARAAAPSALRHPALSEAMGAAPRAARRHRDLRAAGAAGGRAAVRAVLRPRHRAGSAAAVLRAGQGVQPCVHRAPHADRLRPRHGVRRRSTRRPGKLLGVVRLHANANYERGEYAILVRSDLKGRGIGWMLMQMIIDYARTEGIRTIEGQVLAREHLDARDVPRARLRDRGRSRRCQSRCRQAVAGLVAFLWDGAVKGRKQQGQQTSRNNA